MLKLKSVSCNNVYELFLKRFFDIVFSAFFIVVLSPVFVLLIILVWWKNGRPVFFKQERPGLNEKIFVLYKFRTMTDSKDEYGNLLSDTCRLTSFGRFLRSSSLDEMPELFNILIGDMSFVGPRPLSVLYLPFYTEEERKRHSVRPGLTGLAQVSGRNALSWEEKFKFDSLYVERVCFFEDFRIFLRTIFIVIRGSDIGQAEEAPESLHILRKNKFFHDRIGGPS